MFAEIQCDATCPTCSRSSSFGVQFQYGCMEGQLYRLGDAIMWGASREHQEGFADERAVVVAGMARCTGCQNTAGFEVHILRQTIVRVILERGVYPYAFGDCSDYHLLTETELRELAPEMEWMQPTAEQLARARERIRVLATACVCPSCQVPSKHFREDGDRLTCRWCAASFPLIDLG